MKCPHCGKRINPAAIMGSKGGAASKGTEAARERAKKAAATRWKNHKKKEKPPQASYSDSAISR